jgi:Type VI secretion system, TssC, VipB
VSKSEVTATEIKSRSTSEILGASPSRSVLQDLFADLHPALIDEGRDIASIFTPQSAGEFLSQLMNFENLLAADDSYDATVKKLQGQIDQAEGIRDQLLSQVFEQIRPLERSYRELALFFENSKVPDGKVRKPVELYILNADPKASKDVFSMNIAAIENFVQRRNDNFNFRDDICNLVVPGHQPQAVREKFEDIANKWGMLLIGDLDDERAFKNIERNFLPGGKYEFMKRPEDRAAADVCLMGYLQLRPAHWFEKEREASEGLYGPPSLVFAGAVARADDAQGIAQGPVGSRFGQIVGSEKCRVEPLIGEMEHLSMERQLIPIIRDADNHLCFFGCRTQADDPHGVLKFFTSYRILRYLERCCRHYLLQVAGQLLTRDFMEQSIETPLKRLLDEQVEQGTILGYDLFVDKDPNKRMQGICDITLNVMPTGPAETFVLKIDVPDFKKGDENRAS